MRIRSGLTLNMTPDDLGREVRRAWIGWARKQHNPKPSWLVEYDDLSEADQKADRQIGEAVARVVMANLSLEVESNV